MNELFVSNQIYARKADDSGEFVEGDVFHSEIDGSTVAKSLKEGSIAVVTDRGELLIDGSTAGILADVKTVRFVLGRGYGLSPIFSHPYERDGLTVVDYENYQAPQKMVQFIGAEKTAAPVGSINLPSPLVPVGHSVEGYSAILVIKRTDKLVNTKLFDRNYYVDITPYIAGLATADQVEVILDALIAKVNADVASYVVASAVPDGGGKTIGIKLEAKEYGITFSPAIDGVLQYSDIITTTSGEPEPKSSKVGAGRPIQIQELEKRANVERGDTDRLTPEQWRVWKETSQVCDLDSCGYELLTIKRPDQPTGVGELGKMTANKLNLKVAIEGVLTPGNPEGTWAIANSSDVKTILDVLLPLIFGAGSTTLATHQEPATDIV